MSADGLSRVEISHPILQSATNNQVNHFLKEGTVYSSKENLLRQRQEYPTKKTPSIQDEALKHLDNKYASPVNILTGMNSQLSLAQIEADALRSSGGGSVLSDTSSDISDVIPKTNTGNSTSVLPLVEGLNDEDIIQVEMFYRSHKSEIRVCRSLANLYVSAPKLHDRPKVIQLMEKTCRAPPQVPAEKALDPLDFSKDEWEFSKTGVPVLVLDTGQHVRERRLTILLAEKGTGFTLWQDQVNHLTRYSTPHTNFHTITISTDSTRLVGLSFDDGNAAADFADAVRKLISNPDDDMLKLGKKKKHKKEKNKQKAKLPKKVDISQPCCFVHVTKLERPNLVANLYPLAPSESQADTWGRAMSENSGISESTSSLDQ